MSKHTPSPWVWEDKYDFREHKGNRDWSTENFKAGRIKLIAEDGTTVLAEWSQHADDAGIDVSEANARLIAAAPDLLAALEGFTDYPKDLLQDFCDNPEGVFTMTVPITLMAQAVAATRKAKGEE